MARGRPFKCPYAGCGSSDTVSKGFRKTKTMGIRRLRYCKDCKRKFTPRNQKPVEQQIAEQPQEHPAEQSTEQTMGP
jgi:transcriptional regulator NrdR family protein